MSDEEEEEESLIFPSQQCWVLSTMSDEDEEDESLIFPSQHTTTHYPLSDEEDEFNCKWYWSDTEHGRRVQDKLKVTFHPNVCLAKGFTFKTASSNGNV